MEYDVIVIGAGSGGLTASIGLAGAGKKVALIEKGDIGGDCTNFGCVPSKALIDIAKNNIPLLRKEGVGVVSALEEVRKRRELIKDEETPEKIEKYGLKVIKGVASFKDKNTVVINNVGDETFHPIQEITAKNIIISTGSYPSNPIIKGLDKKFILTNESVFEQKDNIKELIVVGGGYIGCELAESFANLGVNVTIVQRNTRLVPREEKEASKVLQEVFESKGIKIICNSVVREAKNNELYILDKDGVTETKLKFDKVLLAMGRSANIDKLKLENVGIKFNKGIKVDKYNRTNIKNIFAIGDCVENNPQFTHLANNEARGVIRNIILPYIKSSVRNVVLPAVLYTNIEIARVGKTRKDLLKSFVDEEIKTEIIYFNQNDRSKLTQDTTGFVKINFKALTGTILGATVVGKSAGEILPVLGEAMENNISGYKLSKQIFAYPTKAELVKKVADKFVISTISNLKKEILFFLKNNILQLMTALIWLSLVSLFLYYKNSTGLTIPEIAINLYNFIKSNSSLGPLIYILFYAVRPIIFFPATLMTFMSGALFGFLGGLAFTLVGENLSAMFAYFLGRVFGKKIIKEEGSSGIIIDLKNKANKSPFISILMTRLLFFPFDMVNYISGFLKINFKGFVFATFIGIIPGASVFILAGSAFYDSDKELTSFTEALKGIDVSFLLYAGVLFVFTLVLAKILKKKYNS